MIFRRNRFADTISRQLDLFAEDEAHGLLADVQEHEALLRRAPSATTPRRRTATTSTRSTR